MSTRTPLGPSERELLAGLPPPPAGITLPTGRLPRRRTGRTVGARRPLRILLVAAALALLATGCLPSGNGWGTGYGGRGQLGRGDASSVREPAAVTGGRNWSVLSAGTSHSCGIDGGGDLYCWGANQDGRLGLGDAEADVRTPTRVGTLGDWIAVSAGHRHTCGLRDEGRLYCWGNNDLGQAVPAVAADVTRPTEVVPGTKGFTRVTAGKEHSCAIRGDRRALCWGRNDDGRLGTSETGRQVHLVIPPGPWREIDAWAHTCGVQADGAGLCWGRGSRGQLGNGGRADHFFPQLVWEVTGFREIEVGEEHSCGRTGNAVYCWGSDAKGQLGNGSTTGDRLVPQQLALPAATIDVSVGARHGCAVGDDGRARCWGANANGQLGDGSTLGRGRPVDVRPLPGGRRVLAAAAGGDHTLLLEGNLAAE